MRFMMMTTDSSSTPPSPEMYAEMCKLIEQMTKSGVPLPLHRMPANFSSSAPRR